MTVWFAGCADQLFTSFYLKRSLERHPQDLDPEQAVSQRRSSRLETKASLETIRKATQNRAVRNFDNAPGSIES